MSKNAIINTPRLTHLDVLYVTCKGNVYFLIVQGFKVQNLSIIKKRDAMYCVSTFWYRVRPR